MHAKAMIRPKKRKRKRDVLMMYNRAQLKKDAKSAISAARPRPALILLLNLVLCFLISNFLPMLVPGAFDDVTDPLVDAMEEAFEEAADYIEDEGGTIDDFMYAFEDVLEEEMYKMEDDDDYEGVVAFFEVLGDSLNYSGSLSGFFEIWDEALEEDDDFADFFRPMMRRAVWLSVLSCLVSLAATLITMVLQYGYYGYSLELFRTGSSRVGKLFSAFPRILQIVGTSIMVGIYAFLWSLLYTVMAVVAMFIGSLFDGEIAAIVIPVLWLAAGVFYVAILLRYALVPFVVVDESSLGVFACIRRSKELMKGRKFKLFVLELSFIGWSILVSLIPAVLMIIGIVLFALIADGGALGLAVVLGIIFLLLALIVPLPLQLWLTSYMNVSHAGFYHIAAASAPSAAPAYTGPSGEPAAQIPAAPVEPSVAPVEIPVAPVEVPAAPVEHSVAPVETPVAPVEPPVAPVDTPAAPAEDTPGSPE